MFILGNHPTRKPKEANEQNHAEQGWPGWIIHGGAAAIKRVKSPLALDGFDLSSMPIPMNEDSSGAKQKRFSGSFLLLLLLLGGALAVLCRQGFRAYEVFWSNDLPLGAVAESSARLPGSFFGYWADFYWLGGANVAFPPNLSNILLAILTPQVHLKFYAPLSMLFLGFGAWFFFRQLRFGRMACVIGGLGAGLNMHFFSNACWGLGTWNVCCGMIFIALGILVSPHIERLWIKGVLAGLSTGMAVMEGFDVGAIMSLYVAAFVVFLFLSTELNAVKAAANTVCVGALLVVCALLIALSTISTLIGTQLTGTAQASQNAKGSEGDWQFMTQWSIPKLETLRVIIPGLFGYRMDMYTTSPDPSGYYWGRVAEDPRLDNLESSDPLVRSNAVVALHLPDQIQAIMAGNDKATQENVVDAIVNHFQMQRRHTGNGEYAGVLVCLLAIFGLVNAARGATSPYSADERRAVWFWGAAALFSLVAAWGRFSYLYALIYHLPLIGNFRNPMKYMHPLNVSLIILSGYGLEALSRQYLATTTDRSASFFRQIATWWKWVSAFEKWWAAGCAIVLAGAVAGYFMLSSSKPNLVHYLLHHGFDATTSPQIANFCVGQVARFILYFAVSVGAIVCISCGAFSGRKSCWALALLGVIMICDLSRADAPWIRYYNYKEKIGLNPVVDLLRHEPWEHRVNSRIWPAGGYMTPNLTYLCHWWLENDYPLNDIQCLEIDQAPRMPVLDSDYLNIFNVAAESDIPRAIRLWQLTNTRYLVAGMEWEGPLNQLSNPKNSFRTVMRMNVVNKPGITQPEDQGDVTVETNSAGKVALFEFTHALPRTKLYADWKTVDDRSALQLLGSPSFDPEKTVLVATNTPVAQSPGSPDADPGTVNVSHYQSKDLTLEADVKVPAVLLLNDHTGDFWNVWVDKTPGTVLRCNDIMRGVFVPAGHHVVEFRYQPPLKLLCVSLSAFGLGIILAGFVIVTRFTRQTEEP